MADKPWTTSLGTSQTSQGPITERSFQTEIKTERRRFKLLRGSYARREFKDDSDKKGKFVHYRADSENDIVYLSKAECDKIGHAFIAPVNDSGLIITTAAQQMYIEKMRQAEMQIAQKGKQNPPWPNGNV